MSKSIKISDENYRKLSSLSGVLREKYERPVSLNETISYLYKRKKISDLAGSWKMSDKEAEEIKKDIRKGWKSWKVKSV